MNLLSAKDFEKLKSALNENKTDMFKAHRSIHKLFNFISFYEWLDGHALDPRVVSLTKLNSEVRATEKTLPGYIMNNTPSAISKKNLQQLLKSGHTLQIRSLHNSYLPLTRLQRDLIKELHCFVSINLYYSPAQSQAFTKHSDPYDFLVLQLDGEKTWKLDQSKTNQVILKKGDLLYVPAHTMHEVKTTTTPSLHLTIALHRLNMVDLLETYYSKSLYKLAYSKQNFDVSSIQSEMVRLGEKLMQLKDSQMTELILATWQRKLSQCFYDENFSEPTDSMIDELKFKDGSWKLTQHSREFIPKGK